MALECLPLNVYCKQAEETPARINKRIQRGVWRIGVQVLEAPGTRERRIDLVEVNKWARTNSLCRAE